MVIHFGPGRVEHVIKGTGMLLQCGFARHNEVGGTHAARLCFLAGRRRHDRHLQTHGDGELDGAMTQPPHAHDCQLIAGLGARVDQRGEDCHASTEQWRGRGRVQIGRNAASKSI